MIVLAPDTAVVGCAVAVDDGFNASVMGGVTETIDGKRAAHLATDIDGGPYRVHVDRLPVGCSDWFDHFPIPAIARLAVISEKMKSLSFRRVGAGPRAGFAIGRV